jgi:hypothetical protein
VSQLVPAKEAVAFNDRQRHFTCLGCLGRCHMTPGLYGVPARVYCLNCSNVSYDTHQLPKQWTDPVVWRTTDEDAARPPRAFGSTVSQEGAPRDESPASPHNTLNANARIWRLNSLFQRIKTTVRLGVDRVDKPALTEFGTLVREADARTRHDYEQRLLLLGITDYELERPLTLADLPTTLQPRPRSVPALMLPSPASPASTPDKIASRPVRTKEDTLAITRRLMESNVRPTAISDLHGSLDALVEANNEGLADWEAMARAVPRPRDDRPQLRLTGSEQPLAILPPVPEETPGTLRRAAFEDADAELPTDAPAVTELNVHAPVDTIARDPQTSVSTQVTPTAALHQLRPAASFEGNFLMLSVDALQACGVWNEEWTYDPQLVFDHLRDLGSRPAVPDDSADRIKKLEEQLAALSLAVESGANRQAEALAQVNRDLPPAAPLLTRELMV